MIKPVSKSRSLCPWNDFQVLKGASEKSMQNFGAPVSAAYEARLLIEDDRRKAPSGAEDLYVIYQRSQNRILRIFEKTPRVLTMAQRAEKPRLCVPLANAA